MSRAGMIDARTVVVTVAAMLLVSACRGQTSEDPPMLPLRNMWAQARFNPMERNNFFTDHRNMRMPVAGTVAREGYSEDDRVSQGREPDSTTYIATIPESVTSQFAGMEAFVQRGQERFGIYCTPCHGRTGDGQGMVPYRAAHGGGYAFPAPPTFHQDRLRHAPDGQIFATITNGVRNMPSYAAQIPINDRWAIVAYLRALQISQATIPGATP